MASHPDKLPEVPRDGSQYVCRRARRLTSMWHPLKVIPVNFERAGVALRYKRPFHCHSAHGGNAITVFEPVQIRVDSGRLLLSRFLRCGCNEIVRPFYVDTPQPLSGVRTRLSMWIVKLHSFPFAQIMFY